jgi:osmotically-inducible protein OsmY
MKRLVPYVAMVAMAAALAGCNRGPGANSAYNNSGASATPGSTSTTVTTTTSSPSSDTSSPSSSTTTAAAPGTDTSTSTSTGNVVSDTVMTGKVKAAISTDPILKDADIMVKTDGGVVVLTGTAKSQDQVAMATNIAQRQDGVSRVDNQVIVK